ncbi:cytochrome P450 [Mycena albidolilacea]|uniref:Cytochrome P450 n=1 Tax=Mycena albidolilacea TaxID=1033008 RepID=A0AAD7ACN5_9AGAR|nr:cytochrome P450 [Mycena albidolilacea]
MPTSFNFLGFAMSDARYAILIAGLITLLVVYRNVRRSSSIRQLNGPPSPSWLFGNMQELLLPPYGRYEFDWQKTYGPVYRVKGCFGQDRLMISDPVALQYILNSPQFQIGPGLFNLVVLIYGKGNIACVREQDHKRIRAALNIGFTAAAIRNYIPIFEKAAQMISEQLEDSSSVPTNVSPILSHATLGTMSGAALGYSLDDLGEEFISNNIEIMGLAGARSPMSLMAEAINSRIPTFLVRAMIHLPTPTFKAIRRAQYLADELGTRAIREKKTAARQGLEVDTSIYGRLLQPQHESTTAKHAMTESEIVAQTAIMMIAGQDTTANTTCFALLELARAPDFQEKLRAEIHATMGSARTSGAAYDSMPLLNALIKEALRLYPAEAITERMAVEDTLIPLSDGITTSKGELISHLPVRQGQIVNFGIASYQRLESRWGDDAHEFKPSRWLGGGVVKGEAVGPYANLLTFLGGPRACIGWRFAVLEMQVFLCELVSKFSFALPTDGAPRASFAGTLQPTMPNGQKGALVVVERVI